MEDIRERARGAAVVMMLNKLDPYARRRTYPAPWRISGGWGSGDTYCEECAINAVSLLRAWGIDEGDDQKDDEPDDSKAAFCEVCRKPLSYSLSNEGALAELEIYANLTFSDPDDRVAYEVSNILLPFYTAYRAGLSDEFNSASWSCAIEVSKRLCAALEQKPQMEMFPLESLTSSPRLAERYSLIG